jgi:hypothetical protein
MLSTVLGYGVALFVSTTVWLTLGAGVYQLVRDGVTRMRHTTGRQRPVIREGYSHRAV